MSRKPAMHQPPSILGCGDPALQLSPAEVTLNGAKTVICSKTALLAFKAIIEQSRRSGCRQVLVSGRARPQDPVRGHMSAPLPMVGSGEPVSIAVHAMEKAGAAVVLVEGKPGGMLTRQDVLTYLATRSG